MSYRNIPLSGFGKPADELARLAVPRSEPSAAYDRTALNGSHWVMEVLPHLVTVLHLSNDGGFIVRYQQDSRVGQLVRVPAEHGYVVEQVFDPAGTRYESNFRPGTLMPVATWPALETNALYRQLGYDDARFDALPQFWLPDLGQFYVALVHRKGKGPIITGVAPGISAPYIGARIATGGQDAHANGTNGNGVAHAMDDAIVIARPEASARPR